MSDPGTHPVQVLVQRQALDQQVLAELVEHETADLGSSAQVEWIDDLATLPQVAGAAGRLGRLLVLVTAPDQSDLTDLPTVGEPAVVRVDLSLREPDRSPGLVRHIQGRGIEGVLWALRTIHHRGRRPEQIIRYGDQADQYGSLRLAPPSTQAASQPVAVLLHGGFWRARWQLDLMDALAVDLAERGMASWNLEYRSPDRHGWAATVADIHQGVAHLSRMAVTQPIDTGRVALVGHSAGGQLAVQLAANLNQLPDNRSGAATGSVKPRLVVQLAGLVDLVETHRRDLGNGAVPTALGGTPIELPEVYAAASPLLRLPVGTRQLVVIGRSDSSDLREMSRRYLAAAGAAGDQVELIEDVGDHFTVIDPGSLIWSRTADAIGKALG